MTPWAAIAGEIVTGRRGGSGSLGITSGVPNGCKHYPDCFTCPFEDCIYTGPPSGDKAKPHECIGCGKWYASPKSLKTHQRTVCAGAVA